MRSIKLPLFAALAVVSVAACSRNRGSDDTASGYPAPADTAMANPTPTPPEPVVTVAPSNPLEGTLGDSVFSGKVGGANCASCHGADAKGTDLAPDLTDDKWLHGDGGVEFIKAIVRDGVPTPKEHSAAMPAFKESLTEQQIDAVASYVRSRSARGAS